MANQQLAIGIDLGGTKIAVGLVDETGKILRFEKIPTRHDGADCVVSDIIATTKKMVGGEKNIVAAGVGMAGQIEALSGVVHFAPNLGWKEFPLGNRLSEGLGLPVHVLNDVRAAAWGEWIHGAGKGVDDLVCLFVGTGIGAGLVSGGRMLIGSNNAAGEVGHMTIDTHGIQCSCGNKGCFETVSAGWGIARRAKEIALYDPTGSRGLLDRVGGNIEAITTIDVFEAYRAGVPAAMKVIEEAKDGLITGVTSLVNLVNPARVILGGGVIQGNLDLIDAIRQGVVKNALKVSTEHLEIVPAALKGDGGVIGAATFARGKG